MSILQIILFVHTVENLVCDAAESKSTISKLSCGFCRNFCNLNGKEGVNIKMDKFKSFDLSSFQYGIVHKDIVSNKLEEIYLWGRGEDFLIGPDSLQQLERLERITLSNFNIKLKKDSLHSNSLKEFLIFYCVSNLSLPENVFDGLPKLENLSIQNCLSLIHI